MKQSFFFYDLETTGFNPRESRITQFGGQRTDLDLKPIGDPVCIFIKATEDVLPDPGAVLITGITPQQTIADGISEAEFIELFNDTINTPGTIFVGFNNIRFDDEFMRFLLYRNLQAPYSWQYEKGRSRWDLLDLIRMTRALRPEGIKWPVGTDGKPTNRLELISSLNKLEHSKAHDALSDVIATIEVAKLLATKQPKLFDFLFEHRDKKSVADLVSTSEPFIYTSGKYPSEYEKTTVVQMLAKHPSRQGILVYDLRHDPFKYAGLSPEEMAEAWKYHKDDKEDRLPVKTLLFNRCPAVAPLSVLDPASQKRIKIDLAQIKRHKEALEQLPDFAPNVLEALKLLDAERDKKDKSKTKQLVDARLYDKFFDDADGALLHKIHTSKPEAVVELDPKFKDERLNELFPLFIARNYPKLLSDEQRKAWEDYRREFLLGGKSSRLANYFKILDEKTKEKGLTANQRFLLEELQLWGESIMPTDVDEEDAESNI